MIKVGDKVRRISGNNMSTVQIGRTYIVTAVDTTSRDSIRVNGSTGLYHMDKFELVQEKKDTTDKKWSFHVHRHLEIDEELIRQDLSVNNPVALVESSTGKCSVLYHHSILTKAVKLKGLFPPEVRQVSDFAKAVAWAKKVRATPWGSTKKKITVSLPTI